LRIPIFLDLAEVRREDQGKIFLEGEKLQKAFFVVQKDILQA